MMKKTQQTELNVGNMSPTKNRGEVKCCGRESSPCSTSGRKTLEKTEWGNQEWTIQRHLQYYQASPISNIVSSIKKIVSVI
jgi:hypothetical protein